MKKIICLLLTFVMVMSLCACAGGGGSAESAPTGLQVGYARENITPEDSVPLGGYGNADSRFSKGYLDYLFGTCIAITGTNGETLLLFALDLQSGGSASVVEEWTTAITAKTGVPVSNMQFHGTHSHSTPSLGDVEYNSITTYRKQLAEKLALAAEAAMADRAESKIYVGKTQVPDLNFVRHYLLDNGTYAGSNFGDFSSGKIVDHSEPKDDLMQLLKFDRVDESKKDIYVMNWAAHPCFTGGMNETNISADFISSTRDFVEAQTGGLFAYFTAAAGNQNTSSQIESEKHGLEKFTYGEKLGQYFLDALPNLTEAGGTEVHIIENIYTAKFNHEGEEKLEDARRIHQYFQQTNDRSAGNALAREVGLSSVYHARAIVTRSSLAETGTMELNVFSVGNVSFASAPYEMFAQSAMDIRAGSAFDTTFVLSMQHDHKGYLPTQLAYDYGCYESHTGYYAPGTAELLVQEYVTMLGSLHEVAK